MEVIRRDVIVFFKEGQLLGFMVVLTWMEVGCEEGKGRE